MLGDRWVFSSPSANYQDSAIGDGSTTLEVCGERSPCSRLVWRCGQPASWLDEVAETGFCGVYLKVIHRGLNLSRCQCDSHPYHKQRNGSGRDHCPVLVRAAQRPDPDTRKMAQRILQVDGLQRMNKKVVARRLAMIADGEAAGRNRWRGWRVLRVTRIVDESALVRSFYVAADDDKPLADYIPGQFLTINPSGQIRCWSVSSWSPSTTTAIPPSYRIAVKVGQSASLYLHSEVRAGDTILARFPSGAFVPDWAKSFPNRQIYVSARIGMTPILSMLQAHSSHPTLSKTPAILMHVARNSEEQIPLLKSEILLTSLIQKLKFYTAPIPDVDVEGRDYDIGGRPTFEHLAPIVGRPYYIDPLGVTPIELPGETSNAYICGPPAFVDDMITFLETCNISTEAIRHETFTYGSSTSLEGDDTSSMDGLDLPQRATVRFRGQEASWEMDKRLSLLELMEQEGRGENPESVCRVGDCGTCEVRILKGEARVSRNAGEEAKEATGKPGTVIRSCCSFPVSALLNLEF